MWSEETRGGHRYVYWGEEVQAVSPGKHGKWDWAVDFRCDSADLRRRPTSQAALFAIGFIGLGQWHCFQGRKRDDLWIGDWTPRLFEADHSDDIRAVVEDNLLAWERHRVGRR